METPAKQIPWNGSNHSWGVASVGDTFTDARLVLDAATTSCPALALPLAHLTQELACPTLNKAHQFAMCVSGTNVPHLSRSSCSCPQLASHSTSLPSTILAVATSTMRHVRLGVAILLYLLSLGANPGVNSFNPSESLLQEPIFSLCNSFHAARAIAFSCNTETSCNSQLAVVLPA